jgi:hypothetical protein
MIRPTAVSSAAQEKRMSVMYLPKASSRIIDPTIKLRFIAKR